MADDAFGRRIPFAFLEDIRTRFGRTYGRAAGTALAYAMNDEFSRVLHQQMEYFSGNPAADAVSRVKAVMVENIDKVLERGDRLELLVDKAAGLHDSTLRFRKQSRRLRQSLWLKNVKLMLAMSAGILFLLYLLVAAFCGSLTLSSC
eukprot:SM000083S22771  [mRNA]  locus=s83:496005:497114:+ [translate_table: standard]